MTATTTRIPASARKVLSVLVQEASTGDELTISYPQIAEKAGISIRWIGSYVTRLEAAGLIEIVPSKLDHRGTPPTTYRILPAGRQRAAA